MVFNSGMLSPTKLLFKLPTYHKRNPSNSVQGHRGLIGYCYVPYQSILTPPIPWAFDWSFASYSWWIWPKMRAVLVFTGTLFNVKKRIAYSFNHLAEAPLTFVNGWLIRKMHYPPETASLMLIAQMIAKVLQVSFTKSTQSLIWLQTFYSAVLIQSNFIWTLII